MRSFIFGKCMSYVLLLKIAILMTSVGQIEASPIAPPAGYAIAAAHPLAVMAGKEILNSGGNAFDAAVAVSAALAVVEPYSSGFGGGGFWLLHAVSGQKKGRSAMPQDIMVDGRETAPGKAHRNMYLDREGRVIPKQSVDGAKAAGIPGMAAALIHIATHYGQMPLERSLEPAIRYAKEGFPVHAGYVAATKKRLATLRQFKESSRIFLDRGQVPDEGWRLQQTDLAKTLTLLAKHGSKGFYQGEVAREMVRAVQAAGGHWTMEDLAQYAVKERAPVQIQYQGARIVSAALPSSGGIVLAEILNMLSLLPEGDSRVQKIHYLVETMRRAYRDRSLWLGDSDFVKVPVEKLSSLPYAKTLMADIQANKATPSIDLDHKVQEGSDTTHFSIIDQYGNRVSATMSINYAFGSGFVAGRSGILLNNEMDDFSVKPGVPNIYGLTGGEANAIEPNKRMLSSMSPTFIDNGQRVAVIGTPGGSRIITMVLLGILTFLDGGDAHSMVAAPRFHHQYVPDQVQMEPQSFGYETRDALMKMGHQLKRLNRKYGDMNVVIWDYQNNVLDAASDPRGHGLGIVVSQKKH